MTFNIYAKNDDYDALFEAIEKENPDFLLVQEYWREHREELSPRIEKLLPNFIFCQGGKRSFLAIYSRFPISETTGHDCNEEISNGQRHSIISVKVEAEIPFNLVTTHFDWPIPADRQFEQNASQRRIWRKNRDIEGVETGPRATKEQYDLFRHYLKARHKDGGMAEMTLHDYEFMVEDTPVHSELIEYRQLSEDKDLDGRLIAVALTDLLPDGISMVYSFFDPEMKSRSLGQYMILDQIKRARRIGLPYVYLGYWVKNSPKMAYKEKYKPLEILSDGEKWRRL
jgi:GNAT superfamily N-acetyltransferase